MKRRAFCTSAASALTAAALPLRSVFAGVEVPAMGQSGKQVVLRSGDLEDLRGGLRGELLVPGQNGYEAARKNLERRLRQEARDHRALCRRGRRQPRGEIRASA